MTGTRHKLGAKTSIAVINLIAGTIRNTPGEVTVFHGDCSGIDKLCNAQIIKLNASVIAVPADWTTHGRAAGPIRNRELIRQAQALDPNPRVLAFKMEGKPNLGTGDCIRQATIAGCEVDVYVIGEEIV